MMRHVHVASCAVMLGSMLFPGAQASADTESATRTAAVAGGTFESVLPFAPGTNVVRVAPFRLDRTPVTNAQFAAFVGKHPQWRRDRIVPLFADGAYLSHWLTAGDPGAERANEPVTRVSWYAARAYCKAGKARLPNWYEWEYVAAASETRTDARADSTWKQQILAWYSRPASADLPDVGQTPRNVHGVQDLHGLVWEWVEDYNGMLVSADNREQSEPDATRFCGPGALSMEQKEHYAILMRIAMLSSLKASYTTATMGFRCAQ